MNYVHAIVDNIWVPIIGIVLMLGWAFFWPRKPRKPYGQRLEERATQLFFERNRCAHTTHEIPCGPRQNGRRFCDEAYHVWKQARQQAIDEMEQSLRYVPRRG